MKRILNLTMALAFLALFLSCKSGKASLSMGSNNFIIAKVVALTMGKDGYTAKVNTEENVIYFATISRTNLSDPSQYKEVFVGNTIEVTGEIWKLGEENHMTVRKLK